MQAARGRAPITDGDHGEADEDEPDAHDEDHDQQHRVRVGLGHLHLDLLRHPDNYLVVGPLGCYKQMCGIVLFDSRIDCSVKWGGSVVYFRLLVSLCTVNGLVELGLRPFLDLNVNC